MTISRALLVALLLWQTPLVALVDRPFHQVPLAKVATTARTHVETCGLVVYVRAQKDGDVHVTIAAGGAKVVLEIIPELPIEPPRKGQTIRVRGITRHDRFHGWPEIHPVLWWDAVTACGRPTRGRK